MESASFPRPTRTPAALKRFLACGRGQRGSGELTNLRHKRLEAAGFFGEPIPPEKRSPLRGFGRISIEGRSQSNWICFNSRGAMPERSEDCVNNPWAIKRIDAGE